MNVCNFVNKIFLMLNYTIFGETETTIYVTEMSLISALGVAYVGVIWFIFIAWWLAPTQFLVNKFNLRNIKLWN